MVANVQASETLKKIWERHQIEAERLRQEISDPDEAFAAFVRGTYDPDVLKEVFREMIESGSFWDDETRCDDYG